MQSKSGWVLAVLASTSLGCASRAWLIVPDTRLRAASCAHVAVRSEGGEQDLGAGVWSTSGVGIEVLEVPRVRRGELHAELIDGSHVELSFDEGDYDSDRNGVPDRDDTRRYGSPGASSFEAQRQRREERREDDERRSSDD